MTKKERLLEELKMGRIVTIETAWMDLGIQSLSKAISRLRDEGHTIDHLKIPEFDGTLIGGYRLVRLKPEPLFQVGDKVGLREDCFRRGALQTEGRQLSKGMVGEVVGRLSGELYVNVAGCCYWFDEEEVEKLKLADAKASITGLKPGYLRVTAYDKDRDAYACTTPEYSSNALIPRDAVVAYAPAE